MSGVGTGHGETVVGPVVVLILVVGDDDGLSLPICVCSHLNKGCTWEDVEVIDLSRSVEESME